MWVWLESTSKVLAPPPILLQRKTSTVGDLRKLGGLSLTYAGGLSFIVKQDSINRVMFRTPALNAKNTAVQVDKEIFDSIH